MRHLVVFLLIGSSFFASANGANVLFGVAANINAASPMVIAGIQSSADLAIARINSQTSIAVTQINADTTKYLSDIQAQTMLSQLMTTVNINAINQAGATDRLTVQLRELGAARRDNLQLAREQLSMEWRLSLQRIALGYRQAEDNYRLGRIALSAQLVKSGLSIGAAASTVTSRLPVSRVLSKKRISPGPMTAGSALTRKIASTPEVRGSSPAARVMAVVNSTKPSVKRVFQFPVSAEGARHSNLSESSHHRY